MIDLLISWIIWVFLARSRLNHSNMCCFPDMSIHVWVKVQVKFFVDSWRAVDASKVTLSFHCFYAKETRWMRRQVKELFQNSPGKILTRPKFILQLIQDMRIKKVWIKNVEANPSSINWDVPRKHRKCHGAICNKVYVHHLPETNLYMFSWHFKNNLCKMQRVLNPVYLKHLGWENMKKSLQFCFQISVKVLHVDDISVI